MMLQRDEAPTRTEALDPTDDSFIVAGAKFGVRICVIFNPAARGNKARRFRRHLDALGGVAFKATAGPGDAQRLAAAAVVEGYDIVAAAGGDGTLNEVLNGLAMTREGLERVRLGVLPLGTVNVFAREMGIPLRLPRAWETLRSGRERSIDLPYVEFRGKTGPERRYFAQLAGAGLDARAVELVSWELKKKAGKLAYVLAGLQAAAGRANRCWWVMGNFTAVPSPCCRRRT
jgi:diacylglycerol kinase (ATP)